MATLGSNSSSPSPSLKNRRKSCARKVERYCCSTITYFPLVFVYGLTTWACWVQASVGFGPKKYGWTGSTSALVGIALYILLNWSYSVAVFTDPGSPLTQLTSAYSILRSTDDDPEMNINAPPMTGGPIHSAVTVKSTGEARYCKKCHTQKPDRAHHCSTCRRCVLKMDHHCPWLATCVGFRNYKAFLLFLIYTCFFCWLCFLVSGTWVMAEIFGNIPMGEQLMPVNCVMLVVLAGILGLVLSGFTGWHIYLASSNQTTIESLESTRYVPPIRRAIQKQQDSDYQHQIARVDETGNPEEEQSLTTQLRNIHANILPGITRPEEGVVTPPRSPTPSYANNNSPAHASLRRNLNSNPYSSANEARHERERYSAYLDEVDTAKLPHAFDLGWRQNLQHIFGPNVLLAWLPICNTTGDGWNWEPSPKWQEAAAKLARDRAARDGANEQTNADKRDDIGRSRNESSSVSISDEDDVPLNRMFGNSPRPRGAVPAQQRFVAFNADVNTGATSNWNDLPDDILSPRGQIGPRPRSRNDRPRDGIS